MFEIMQYRLALSPERTIQVSDNMAGSYAQAKGIFLRWFRDVNPAGECILVLGLNGRNGVVGLVEVARGGAHGCGLVPADILQAAIAMGSRAIIISHNHPSEDPTPSSDDIIMTAAMVKACDAIGVKLLDHIVVAVRSGECTSVME